MIEVIPAVMPKSFGDLKEKASMVVGLVETVQIDVMDGSFVPPKTWPYLVSKAAREDAEFQKLLSEDLGLPFWERLEYEVDLMTSNPEQEAFDWIRAGVKRVILHVESSSDMKALIERIRTECGRPEEDVHAPEIGIAAENDTPFSVLQELAPLVDFVQVMGIAKVGYQGQSFDERALQRITSLRELFPELIISVDGAVNNQTAPSLVKAGTQRLASGSYIFGSANIKETIAGLTEIEE